MPEKQQQPSPEPIDVERRRALHVFSVLAGTAAVGSGTAAQAADTPAPLPPPRRALTGRDAAGKSVFKSFDVTPQVIPIDANPGLTFYELYATEGVPQTPGMHATDTIDYGVVVRGEMTLELDDGQIVHLRQGDCVVQNGTRHRWRNPGTEPCLMAFGSMGGKRGG